VETIATIETHKESYSTLNESNHVTLLLSNLLYFYKFFFNGEVL